MNKTDLTKTVRSLDQTGPGPDGEGLQRLWSCLAASSTRKFHAAEESTLRWLLKSMNGTSTAAETVRRYPLTWTILACVFQRVPLFSLAKSLADRKVIAVLQQTLKDISKPACDLSSPASSKRKKTPIVSYNLNQLQARSGCIETAKELFKTLHVLLGRLENPEVTFSRHQMGVEHIKSLFGASAAEAVKIAAPALAICKVLVSDPCHDSEGCESWVAIISMIWNLHLQGDGDAVEVATHLFSPVATIMARIGDFPSDIEVEVSGPLKNRWSADLQLFMHQNLIAPGKRDFTRHKVFECFARALDVSASIIQVSAPALYFLCSDHPALLSQGELRKENVEWLRRIFRAVKLAIEERSDRSVIMQTVLDRAIRQSTPVDVEDLRHVCHIWALRELETDWALVSKAVTCDPDILQLNDDGHALRGEICDRILKRDSESENEEPMSVVIGAIMDGFRTRRALPSFLQLWFEQLCKEERQRKNQPLLWSKVGQLPSPTPPLGSFLETEISPAQLLGVVSWLETQNPELYPKSTCVFASTVALAIRNESFVDAMGQRLLDLTNPVDGSLQPSALKWRVVSQAISWAVPSERVNIWNSVKSQLSNIMKKSPIVSGVTFEAFKCCFQAWDCMSLEADVDEPALLIESFFKRIVTQNLGAKGRLPFTEVSAKADFQEDSALQQYLMWCTYGSSRFSRLYYARNGDFPPILSNALSFQEAGAEQLEPLWNALLSNEINLNDAQVAASFIDRLVAALDGAVEERSKQLRSQSLTCMKILARIPIEVFSRTQREKIMSVLRKQQASMLQSSEVATLHIWKLVLSLSTKMMGRPTFYPDMSFSDLVEIATAMSDISIDCSSGRETILELIERFLSLASATIRQMADHLDERGIKYFQGASEFVSCCKARLLDQEGVELGLFTTLLKVLKMELSRTPNLRSHEELASLAVESNAVLSHCIAVTMSKTISNKKLSSSSSTAADMCLLAALDAASTIESLDELLKPKSSTTQKFDKSTKKKMQQGDLRAWKIQAFLYSYLPGSMASSRPTAYDSLADLPVKLQRPLLKELVISITRHMSSSERRQYLGELIDELGKGRDTDGQILAIQTVADLLTDSFDQHDKTEGFSLAAAHSELTLCLPLLRASPQAAQLCHVLRTLLEKRPQAMGQWNIEITLSTVCDVSSTSSDGCVVPFASLCRLVEVIIKKHRIRLEGHFHILLAALQALLRNLVVKQPTADEGEIECKAKAYSRLISLICEPTAGAVSRSQLRGGLESATDAAKRLAGRHMYLVMMQYVKLQLEESVPKAVRESMEPAMNAIFDITPPEVRKILNDAAQAGGRAILREMFRRYVKFGKWSGV
ncbi:hypothetical protein L249_6417 [Ophiocordyceps polyrhachis-furcata BCC 54312]|uniref:Nucleolar 27S pre-rRNA processing Urb2/Npa2 C-terminal domain-containing protein n=1 Tax=Ophiocordyceps polyrhachis-furcata BCC 54312 TaxID=1330021 RepID=A0A367LJR3_9HYPO|nr:hypothetical protein L249_6417 [Ophiocordyceps polyrhachis-furcata BCC 54312]